MSIKFNGEEYADLKDYVERGHMIMSLRDIFNNKEVFEIGKKNNFEGIYNLSVFNNYSVRAEGEWVCAFHDVEEDYLMLLPSRMDDERILACFTFPTNMKLDTKHYKIQWTYIPYNANEYKTKEDEMVSFEGDIVKIKPDDFYVTDNGINYQANFPEIVYPGISYSKEELINDLDLDWSKMEKDNFMGKLVRKFITCTGEIYSESYTFNNFEDDLVIFENCEIPNRNSDVIPHIVKDGDGNWTAVRTQFDVFYEPYSIEEEV